MQHVLVLGVFPAIFIAAGIPSDYKDFPGGSRDFPCEGEKQKYADTLVKLAATLCEVYT